VISPFRFINDFNIKNITFSQNNNFTCFLILTTNKPLVKPCALYFEKFNIFIAFCLILGKYILSFRCFIAKRFDYCLSYPQLCFII